jgi:CPA1 family monovalent cation:H+ antiporter
MTPSATVEFLILLLIVAALIAVAAARLRIPYTVALVLGGLLLGTIHSSSLRGIFSYRPDWLTPDVSLIIFLPALLFEGSLKIPIRQLRENLFPILLLANVGVLSATMISGFALHWALGIPLLIALVFGAIVAATDPISVLSIFKNMAVDKRLSVIVEGESLFNDGTAVVLYGILYAAVMSSHLGIWIGIREFFVEVLGGAAIGIGFGYLFSKLTQKIDDPQIEITLTTILAYGAYLLAQSLHVSGVIATVLAGLIVGNFGIPHGMSSRTQIALWSFWEYASFFINSILFLLIGLRVHIGDLMRDWVAILLAIAVVLAGRALSVYGLIPITNLFPAKVPFRWQHILIWGGMRGALSLAMALSLGNTFPYRDRIVNMTFAVVGFTIIVQGITIKPLLRVLGLTSQVENDYTRARASHNAVTSAISELEDMLKKRLISEPVYQQLHEGLSARMDEAIEMIQSTYAGDHAFVLAEVQMARTRLIAAERKSVEQALHQGLIVEQTATTMINEAKTYYDEFITNSGRSVVDQND